MKKKLLIIIGIVAVLASIPYGFARHYGLIKPLLKITDPTSPLFNPNRFRFNDYTGREDKVDAFRKMFSVGTPKEFVDQVLVEAGGAKSAPIKEFPQVWRYNEPMRFGLPAGPVHIFIFNENNELENIQAFADEILYPDRLTLRKLKQQKYPEEK